MDFLRRHKRAFITAVIALCLLMIGAAGINKINSRFFGDALGIIVTPAESFFESVRRKLSDVGEFFANFRDLAAENAALREENESLREENIRLSMAEKDNDKLVRLLNLAESYAEYPKMGAEIIAKDPGNWYNAYAINKGAKDGLKKNMIVLASGGLAGKITEVYENYAKIVSLIDDTSSVAARSARTGGVGFVKGDTFLMMDGLCKMELIPPEADITVGDVIVTGRLSTIYPPNIPIGEVVEISRDPTGMQSAIIRPFVDFTYMETILVVTELFENEFARDE